MAKKRTRRAKIQAVKHRHLTMMKTSVSGANKAFGSTEEEKKTTPDQPNLINKKFIKQDLGKSLLVTIILLILLFGITLYLR